MGGSYGGYATLAGLTFTPDNLCLRGGHRRTFQSRNPALHHPALLGADGEAFPRTHGDPNTEEGRAILRAASPLYKADQIKRPLLMRRKGPMIRG